MTKIKCGTFGNLPIPKEILKKMEADRAEAESKHETKAKTLPIQRVSPRSCLTEDCTENFEGFCCMDVDKDDCPDF